LSGGLESTFVAGRVRGASSPEELAAARKVVVAVANSEHGAPFSDPVSPDEAPDYGDYILHPMDLGTIAHRLKRGQYDSCGEFFQTSHPFSMFIQPDCQDKVRYT